MRMRSSQTGCQWDCPHMERVLTALSSTSFPVGVMPWWANPGTSAVCSRLTYIHIDISSQPDWRRAQWGLYLNSDSSWPVSRYHSVPRYG
jgi:hypothetical protein